MWIVLSIKLFNQRGNSWEMDRRGKSWCPLISFMYKALSFPTFPESDSVCVWSLFKWLFWKVPGFKQHKWAVLVEAGLDAQSPVVWFPWHPNWPSLTCLQGIPELMEHNLKPLHRSKGLRDVGMLSISVGSLRGNLAKISPATPDSWTQYIHSMSTPKQSCPTCTGLWPKQQLLAFCSLTRQDSPVRGDNGFIYKKQRKVCFYTLP